MGTKREEGWKYARGKKTKETYRGTQKKITNVRSLNKKVFMPRLKFASTSTVSHCFRCLRRMLGIVYGD